MKKYITYKTLLLTSVFAALIAFNSCKKDEIIDPNNPSLEGIVKNATIEDLNTLATGLESALRNNHDLYIDDAGILGREHYRFSGADPRYSSELLGEGSSSLDNNAFYITNVWTSRYRAVKNANVLIEAVNKSTYAKEGEKKGYLGFAKTMKAYQFLLVVNLTNSIRIDVNDPTKLGSFVSKEEALTAISDLLEDAKSNLQAAGASFPFKISTGFSEFNTPAAFLKFNRAIAARVALYRQKWDDALTNVNASFLDLTGNFSKGAYMVYSDGTGDLRNNLYYASGATGETRVVQPSFAKDSLLGDDRLKKAIKRPKGLYTVGGLTSDRDINVYSSLYDKVGIIRNEELILIYAEANIQKADFTEAVKALNVIRTGHGVAVYSGGLSKDELITELLTQRRYSLFFEGHRWIDMRRYGKLSDLPIDRPNDNVWAEFPIPFAENQ